MDSKHAKYFLHDADTKEQNINGQAHQSMSDYNHGYLDD